MEERVYKLMKGAGIWNIALGIITLVVGSTCGILMIIAGVKLQNGKSKLMF